MSNEDDCKYVLMDSWRAYIRYFLDNRTTITPFSLSATNFVTNRIPKHTTAAILCINTQTYNIEHVNLLFSGVSPGVSTPRGGPQIVNWLCLHFYSWTFYNWECGDGYTDNLKQRQEHGMGFCAKSGAWLRNHQRKAPQYRFTPATESPV